MIWMVSCGMLAMLVQAGFALFDTGLCRAKNAAHTMSTCFLVFAMSVTGFFLCGFALMAGHQAATGGPAADPGDAWRFIGHGGGFLLCGAAHNGQLLAQFVCLLAFISIAATIPAGALAERWSAKGAMIFGLLSGAVICPVYGFWVWGGGWLAELGSRLGWGHGVVDFAGSGVMHLQGGALALVAALLLGPRIGKFDADGRPRAILGHHLPMVSLGTLVLALGWSGLMLASAMAAPASSPAPASDGRVACVAANALLAGVAGILASATYMWLRFGKPDPSMMCNGMLAGLVAIAAPCTFVQPWAAFLIGLIAGLLVVLGIFFCERCGVDDPVGAISVHGVSGAWGLLALGLFADGSYGATWNVVAASHGVTGLFYGDGRQLLAQLIGVAACVAWAMLAGGFLFWAVGRMVGNRVPAAVEIAGLDIPEMGAPGYPEFMEHITPEMISRSDIAAAELALSGHGARRMRQAESSFTN